MVRSRHAPTSQGRLVHWLAGLFLLIALQGCQLNSLPPAPTETRTTASPITTDMAATATPALPEPTLQPTIVPTQLGTEANVRELTVFYTNDEHGWMEGMEEGQGAANLMTLWRAAGYVEGGSTLLISGGDMWTGPAISTWFEGESMAEVMNAMGYDAAAVGNHEFDFGLDVLQVRAAESEFPFLSANVRTLAGDTPEAWGIQPYTIVERNGVRVGIIGLTTTSTPVTTNPVNVSGFEFLDYEAALREVVPEVKAEGAELLLVAGHVCRDELESLAAEVTDLGIHLLGGGHCNELFAEQVGDIVVLEGGYHFTSYASVTFEVSDDDVVATDFGVVPHEPGAAPDPEVAAVVEAWQERAADELNTVIGYTAQGLARRSDEMQQLVTETWLLAYPAADVAITNRGGFRAALDAGDITLSDIVGMLPFNNVLVEVELSGAELLQVLAHANAAVAGARLGVGEWILEESDQPIEPDETYLVLVNDFMYAGGDEYTMLAEYDPDAYNTAIDWRQPVIDWILRQESSADDPIDEAIRNLAQ